MTHIWLHAPSWLILSLDLELEVEEQGFGLGFFPDDRHTQEVYVDILLPLSITHCFAPCPILVPLVHLNAFCYQNLTNQVSF